MQIASITFDGEKKKSTNFIIPATFFTSLSPTKKQDLVEEVKPETITKEVSDDAVVKVISNPKEIAKPPIIQNLKRRNNSLSLKSIHQKKKQQKISTEINYENYPKDSFSVKDLRKTWSDYQKIQTKKGEKNMASILAASLPELSENFKVHFILPNKLMEDQLKIGKPKLLMFLRESLNNFSITVDVSVSETIEKKFAYTPQEKYNKLKEKNPLLEKLKDTFQLDL
jgi:DNA polymerase-3 subunit gamma/tau